MSYHWGFKEADIFFGTITNISLSSHSTLVLCILQYFEFSFSNLLQEVLAMSPLITV